MRPILNLAPLRPAFSIIPALSGIQSRVARLRHRAELLEREASRLRDEAQGLMIRDWLLRRST